MTPATEPERLTKGKPMAEEQRRERREAHFERQAAQYAASVRTLAEMTAAGPDIGLGQTTSIEQFSVAAGRALADVRAMAKQQEAVR